MTLDLTLRHNSNLESFLIAVTKLITGTNVQKTQAQALTQSRQCQDKQVLHCHI